MEDNYKILEHPEGKVDLVNANIKFLDTVTPGFYKAETQSMGFFSICNLVKDKSIQIPRSALEISKEYIDLRYINQYFSKTSTDLHKKLDIKQKLGILLHGIQGTGKTTGCYAVAQELIKTHKAIVVTVTSYSEYDYTLGFLNKIKEKTGTFLSVIIFDECEEEMREREANFKRLLDSSSSLDMNITFFTTNHLHRIPTTIRDRPSRIKFCTEVGGVQDEEVIYSILDHMNRPIDSEVQLNTTEIKSIVRDLKGQTLDVIKNTFIDKVFEINYAKKVEKKQPDFAIDVNVIQEKTEELSQG